MKTGEKNLKGYTQRWLWQSVGMVVLVVVASLVLGGTAWAKTDTAVDWDEGVISSVAMSDPMAQNGTTMGQKIVLARTSAIAMAEADLLGVVKGINLDRATTIKEAIVAGDIIERKVEGEIRRAMTIEEGINELDLYEVRLAVRINEVADAVTSAFSDTGADAGLLDKAEEIPDFHRVHELNCSFLGLTESDSLETGREPEPSKSAADPRSYETGKKISGSFNLGSPSNYSAPESEGIVNVLETGWDHSDEAGYSSLVLNGREIDGLLRDRSPAVYSEDGQVVFRGWEIPYFRKLTSAVQAENAGTRPLVIQAAGFKDGETSPHLVVSNDDARKIMAANKQRHFLEDGNVMIVIGDDENSR